MKGRAMALDAEMFNKNLSEKLQPPYSHFIPIVRFYWHNVMKNIVKMLDTPKECLILDFGCGKEQYLKKYLPGYNIIGYDIVRKFSDVDDFRHLRPYAIVCSHVLEHLEEHELLETIGFFKKMCPRVIITAQPTENLLARVCNFLWTAGYLKNDFRLKSHKLRINEIHEILYSFLKLEDRKNIFTLTVISKWSIE